MVSINMLGKTKQINRRQRYVDMGWKVFVWTNMEVVQDRDQLRWMLCKSQGKHIMEKYQRKQNIGKKKFQKVIWYKTQLLSR